MYNNRMKKSTSANLILIAVSAMWGLTFPLIYNAVAFISPGEFVAARIILASLVIAPFVIMRLVRINRLLIIGSIVLAILNTATYIFQSQGLTTIPASRSAFITGICVVIVPLLMPLFRLGKPDAIAYSSVAVCLVGLYILTGANLRHLNMGDFWTFDCAITYALYIILIQIMSSRVKDYSLLCFLQISLSIPLALPFAQNLHIGILANKSVLIALVFCAVFATVLSLYLQGRFQQYTTAAKAALIFSLEPIFATIFAYFINHTAITLYTVVGGVLILMSVLLRDVWLMFNSRGVYN